MFIHTHIYFLVLFSKENERIFELEIYSLVLY